MQRTLAGLMVVASLAVACASSSTTTSAAATGSVAQTAEQCAAGGTFVTDGTLTVGTDSPAYPPYFQGGTQKGSE